MAIIHFTKRVIDGIKATSRRQTFTDETSRGLTLLVTPNGVKTFYLTRKFEGRVERNKLGRFPEMSLSKARVRAAKLQVQYDAGINPAETKRRERKELTLDEFFEIYYRDHCKVRNRHPEVTQNVYKRNLQPVLGRVRLSKIGREDIRQLMQKHGDKGHKRTANTIHALIRAMLNKAIGWEYLEGNNPALHIDRYPEKSRDRFLSPEELVRFHAALLKEPDETNRDCIYTILLTGARKSNVFSMQWSHIDLDQAIWRIPDTKNGTPQLVVLAPEVITILKRRRARAKSLFVFHGTGKKGHIVDIKKTWQRLLDRAGIDDLWVHDLRRTFGSWMLADGHSLSVIGKALGHKDIQSTQIYARLSVEQLRDPVYSVSSRLTPNKLS